MNETIIRLKLVRQRINNACNDAGREPNEVSLLAVSKRHPAKSLLTLNQLGVSNFGENQLQEALLKQQQLSKLDLEWHFIGTIQSNKTGPIAEHFQWVQSVDRSRVLNRLAAQRPATLDPLNICLQVNIDGESQKAGAPAEQIFELASLAEGFENIKLRGLMVIPEMSTDPVRQRDSFRRTRMLFLQLIEAGHQLDTLSMGMSSDLEIAIAEGSTMVRIGTDLFGPRET